ncbi:hypothetical protein OL548_34340 (plasmid) [Lysinibacillus sp. MHQ-1]|nr:hypothetical protein OL548_34340 [Lysinibacillus sp. MHQ-1]
MDGGVASMNWNNVLLMPSFKLYKAFTKVMSDVVNNTDEAANDHRRYIQVTTQYLGCMKV